LQCQEKMDVASAKLSRIRSMLSVALKAGAEATKGELLDAIESALEGVDAADAALREGENQGVMPGRPAPADLAGNCHDQRVVPLSSRS
jgi:hypothetical protein